MFGCIWEYRGAPCDLVKPVIETNDVGKTEVVGWWVTTGVGPEIKADLEDLRYEVKKDA